MQSCAILPFAMGSPCQEMSRDHVIAVIAWLLCQWLQARRELQPYAPQILTLETKLTSTSVACMPGACLVHAWCQAAGCCDRFHPGCFRQRAICQQPSRTSSPAKPRSRMESHQDHLQWEHLCSKWMQMNAHEYIPFHSTPSTLHIITLH